MIKISLSPICFGRAHISERQASAQILVSARQTQSWKGTMRVGSTMTNASATPLGMHLVSMSTKPTE